MLNNNKSQNINFCLKVKKKNSTFVILSPFPESTDNASVNFVKYKGDYYVSTESNYMHRVYPDTLESKQKV